MAVYLCRWPNGEFSIVSARTKDDAIELLDEWGNAEQASLTRMTDCIFDFRLSDDGQIELAGIGEATEEYIMGTCIRNSRHSMRSKVPTPTILKSRSERPLRGSGPASGTTSRPRNQPPPN